MPSQRQRKNEKTSSLFRLQMGGLEGRGREKGRGKREVARGRAAGDCERVGLGELLGFSCHLVVSSGLGHRTVPSGLVVMGRGWS